MRPMAEMRKHDVAGGHGPTAPLSTASTVCASPQGGEDKGPTWAWPVDAEECQGHERSQKPAQVYQGHLVDSKAYGAGDFESSGSSDVDADDDDLDTQECADIVVREDEMQARVRDAMRGLERLEGMNIDARELPTVRALFVRWSIAQWALVGQAHTAHSHATPQGRDVEMQRQAIDGVDIEADGEQVATASTRVAACFGHAPHDARKCARGDGVSRVFEDMQLGHIRGPGCRVVKQCCSIWR